MTISINKLEAEIKRREQQQAKQREGKRFVGLTLDDGTKVEMPAGEFDSSVRTLAGFPTLSPVTDADKLAHNVELLRRTVRTRGAGQMLLLAGMILSSIKEEEE